MLLCSRHCIVSCAWQVRGIKTNIPFLENVFRHPEFLAGAPTTSFIERNSKELFRFEGHGGIRASKLLLYLADMVSGGYMQVLGCRLTNGLQHVLVVW